MTYSIHHYQQSVTMNSIHHYMQHTSLLKVCHYEQSTSLHAAYITANSQHLYEHPTLLCSLRHKSTSLHTVYVTRVYATTNSLLHYIQSTSVSTVYITMNILRHFKLSTSLCTVDVTANGLRRHYSQHHCIQSTSPQTFYVTMNGLRTSLHTVDVLNNQSHYGHTHTNSLRHHVQSTSLCFVYSTL